MKVHTACRGGLVRCPTQHFRRGGVNAAYPLTATQRYLLHLVRGKRLRVNDLSKPEKPQDEQDDDDQTDDINDAVHVIALCEG